MVADGPRNSSDQVLCNACRRLIDHIDWPCLVETCYSEVNLGCRLRLATGLTWVFERVEFAVILEDDCIPHLDFFPFTESLLLRYQHDASIMMIGGSQPLETWSCKSSYAFSKYALIWGWATWRRAWKHYNVDMLGWPEFRLSDAFAQVHEDLKERLHWEKRLQRAYDGHTTWDHQWSFSLWKQKGLSVLPATNLVQNIGFGPDATHTTSESAKHRLSVPAQSCKWPLLHPSDIKRDVLMDRAIFNHVFDV